MDQVPSIKDDATRRSTGALGDTRAHRMDLNQVTLPCRDYDESVGFYIRLGFRQIVGSPPRYARFECASGSTFSVEQSSVTTRESVATVYFEVSDVDAEVDRIRKTGVTFDELPEDKPWLWREARLHDPAGNRICIYHAGSNRRFPPWRIGGDVA